MGRQGRTLGGYDRSPIDVSYGGGGRGGGNCFVEERI